MTTRPALIGPVSALRQALILLQEQGWRFIQLTLLWVFALAVLGGIVWFELSLQPGGLPAPGTRMTPTTGFTVLFMLLWVVGMLASLLYNITLMQLFLPRCGGLPTWRLLRGAAAYLPSMLFLVLLVLLYVLAGFLPAVLLGELLAYLTGFNALLGIGLFCGWLASVWLMVRCLFSGWVLLEEGVKGRANLRRAMALVRGRWWAVLWRFVALYLIGLPVFVAQGLLGVWAKAPVVSGIFGFVLQLAFMGLLSAYSKVLFDDLRRVQGAAVPAMEPLPAPAMA